MERPRSVSEVGVHRVAGGAVVTQCALMDVFMAGRAIRSQIQERSRGVTVRAVTGEFAVETLDGESSLFSVIEIRRIDGTQISVASLMFNVAHGAISDRNVPMDSLLRIHSFRNLIVADETSVPVDIEVVIVATVAAVWILQPLVSDTEPAGHEIDLIFLGERRPNARDQNHRQYEEKTTDPDTPHRARAGMRIAMRNWTHRHWRLRMFGLLGRLLACDRAKSFGNRARGILSSQCTLAPNSKIVLPILTCEYLNYRSIVTESQLATTLWDSV